MGVLLFYANSHFNLIKTKAPPQLRVKLSFADYILNISTLSCNWFASFESPSADSET